MKTASAIAEALRRAIESGVVEGAGLDVFEQEPPKDWALAQMPQDRPATLPMTPLGPPRPGALETPAGLTKENNGAR